MNEDVRDLMLVAWLNEGPDRGSREGLERALAATRTARQRLGWTFLDWWLPGQLTIGRVRGTRFVATAVFVVLLALMLALAAAFVGSRPRLPAPLGPAANGLMAMEAEQGVYLVRPDGSERRKINGALEFARSPEFSPDGTRVAFVANASDTDIGGPLFVAPTDGSRPPINVSGDVVVARAYYPAIAWSPDGARLAFGGYVQGVTSIVVAASDGSGAVAITDRTAIDDLPSWSPDGSLIAYRITPFDRSSRSLAVARPDGSDERILATVTGPEATLSIAHWSPDSSRLAYLRTDGDTTAVVADLNGHETSLGRAWAYGDTGVPWSPEGRSVALLTEPDGVVVVDADGLDRRALGKLAFCWIEWSPDGTSLYGPRGDHCAGDVRVIPIARPEMATTAMEGVLSWQRVAP
jgi:Tol biopolymer transport system component